MTYHAPPLAAKPAASCTQEVAELVAQLVLVIE